jgi:class 3 adenylate cyclase
MASRGMGPVARRLSIATRVALLIVLVAVVSLAVTAALAFERGAGLLNAAVSERLDAVVAGRADGVALHIRARQDRVTALAASPATGEAVLGFAAALEELAADPVTPDLEDGLADHYLEEVIPGLEAVRGTPVPVSSLLPVTDAAVRLQAGWVTAGEDEVPPSAVDDNRDGTAWTSLHTALHPTFRRLADEAGFTDLALVSAAGDVVYTVSKGIDLGTNLRVGPHSGSVLAVAVSRVVADPVAGQSVLGDIARTEAAGDRPVGVVASPVFDGGRFVGVAVGQFDAAPFASIMSAGGGWTGLGQAGQVYLAAADGTMRSDDRGFLVDPQGHLEAADEQLTASQGRAIRELGTTVAFQPVDADLVRQASDGPGRGAALSPTGTEVVASWRPLGIEGLDWIVAAEVPRSELGQPVARFARIVLVAVAIVVLVTTFAAVWWANRLVEPLRQVSDRLRRTRAQGALTSGAPALGPRTPREYRELSDHIDDMLMRLKERQQDVRRAQAERLALLRQFLPPTMAVRAEAGEQDVLDRVERASVVVVELRGLGGLLQGDSRAASRDLLGGLVDNLDAAARQHGLERFRLGGNAYAAVCGASRPHLDHAPRALAFARDARDIVDALASEAGTSVASGVGLASGAVVVGLSGGDRLVFDCWGATVDRAGDLARAAAGSEVLVDPAARALLPEAVVTSTPVGPRPHGALRVAGETTSVGAEG